MVVLFALFAGFTLNAQINNPRQIEQEWQTDTTIRSIPLNELTILLKRNQISPLNQPQYISKAEANKRMNGMQPVIAVEINGEARAYPLSMLSYHEIVNDRLGDTPICISYCPLCNSAIAFDRRINTNGKSRTLTFGTSGMLRKSNLVMWDEQTQTWWQQFTGEGIVGKYTDRQIRMLPAMLISLKHFLTGFPDGRVLMPQETAGKKPDYTRNPYESYDSIGVENPRLFFGKVDKRLPAMTRVINVQDGTIRKIYPLDVIADAGVIHDRVGNKPVVLFYQGNMVSNLDAKKIAQSKKIGAATVFHRELRNRKLTFEPVKKGFRDKQTGSLWRFTGKCISGELKGEQLQREIYGHHFAFAWFAFYPESNLYKE